MRALANPPHTCSTFTLNILSGNQVIGSYNVKTLADGSLHGLVFFGEPGLLRFLILLKSIIEKTSRGLYYRDFLAFLIFWDSPLAPFRGQAVAPL